MRYQHHSIHLFKTADSVEFFKKATETFLYRIITQTLPDTTDRR